MWNVVPWLDQCLASVEQQTLGTGDLELIAIDDGSTDGSGERLDAFAATRPWVTVVHQANSGGPGAPRNVGLDRAVGRYVFFLDADDYLGTEALERLVAMAERARSDIVLGQMVGVEGRGVRRRSGVFVRNHDRVSPERVFRSGNVLKLFRRSMLDRTGLRFQPGVVGGEDGDFMASAYLEADVISVVADYDCYYARQRPGSQTTRADRRDDLVEYIGRLEEHRIRVAVSRRPPGLRRQLLLAKPFIKMAAKFSHAWPSRDPDERRRVFDAGAAVVGRWYGPGVERHLPQRARLVLHCLATGKQAELEDITAATRRAAYLMSLTEDGRVYARFPHFRDGSGIPDACYDITGELRLQAHLGRAALANGHLEPRGPCVPAAPPRHDEHRAPAPGAAGTAPLRHRAGQDPAAARPLCPLPEFRVPAGDRRRPRRPARHGSERDVGAARDLRGRRRAPDVTAVPGLRARGHGSGTGGPRR